MIEGIGHGSSLYFFQAKLLCRELLVRLQERGDLENEDLIKEDIPFEMWVFHRETSIEKAKSIDRSHRRRKGNLY
jgi:hypothetical protein